MGNKIAWIGDRLFKWRWTCGMFLLVLCVACELHGSSIGIYSQWLDTPDTVVFGKNRMIRSDEWKVFTPFAFSQYYDNFQYFSPIVRAYPTDMFMLYGQAVKDFAMIFRPTQWGYLLLPPGGGLASFWMGRWILLFLVSFEFAMMFLERNRLLSLTYAFAIAFAPIVQWWFSVNSIAEILIFGQLCVIIFSWYVKADDLRKRILLAVFMAWSLGVFVLSVYPAWQVSCGYVFMVFAAWIVWQSRGKGRWCKCDACILSMAVIVLVAALAPVFMKSWETIEITRATVYPGIRFVSGINFPFLSATALLMNYVAGFLLPFVDVTSFSNNCELSQVIHFLPLGFIVWFMHVRKNGTHDLLLSLLGILWVVFFAWLILPWPEWIARVTLLSNVTFRVTLPLGIISLMILLRVLSLRAENDPFTGKYGAVIIALVGTIVAFSTFLYLPELAQHFKRTALCSVAVVAVWYCALRGRIKYFAILFVVLSIYAGAAVNPVACGTESIFSSPLLQEIESIAVHDRGAWLVCTSTPLQNVPIMAGAPTINSVNTYPVLERWRQIDQENEYEHVYNRYAHIDTNIVEGTTSFSCKQDDLFVLSITPDDLPQIDVRYILSDYALEGFNQPGIKFEQIHQEGIYRIYQVNY